MGLTVNQTLSLKGINITGSYINVRDISLTKETSTGDWTVSYSYRVHSNQTLATTNDYFLNCRDCFTSSDVSNVYQTIYNNIITLLSISSYQQS